MIRYYILLVIIMMNGSVLIAQKEQADRYYNSGYYAEAVQLYEKYLDGKKNNKGQEISIKNLADAYYRLRNVDKSYKWYHELTSMGIEDSLTLMRLLQLTANDCNYSESEKYLDRLSKKYLKCSDCDLSKKRLTQNKITWPQSNSMPHNHIQIEQMDWPIGNYGMGYTFYNDNELLIGTHRDVSDKGTSFYQIALLQKIDNYQALIPIELEKDNGYYIAYPCYSLTTNELIYTANASSKKKFNKKKVDKFNYSSEGENILHLYSSTHQNQQFTAPEILSFCDHNFNYVHPTLSEDGKTLFFSSNEPGGYGGYDIYYSKKINGTWTDPINCGEKINSSFDELTPFLMGKTLFFSSYGHHGYGGSDVFSSQVSNDYSFSSPVNLGKPINSCRDDFSYIVSRDESYALLTSNRESASGDKDLIYKLKFSEEEYIVKDIETKKEISDVLVSVDNKKQREHTTDSGGMWRDRLYYRSAISLVFDNPWYETLRLNYDELNKSINDSLKVTFLTPIYLYGKVVDEITGKELPDVKVTLFEKDEEGNWKKVNSTLTDQEGDWKFRIRKDREYKVEFDKDKYIEDSAIIPRYDEPSKIREDIINEMNPFELSLTPVKDVIVQIDNIYFEYNKSDIKKESIPILEKIKEFLNNNKEVKIELSAHTDCIGSDAYNLQLSQKRANSCFNYLVKAGIDKNRVKAVGYGKRKMIVKDCELQKRDDKQAQKNRRVEMKIL